MFPGDFLQRFESSVIAHIVSPYVIDMILVELKQL